MAECQDREIGAFPQVSPHEDIVASLANSKKKKKMTTSTSISSGQQTSDAGPVVGSSDGSTSSSSSSSSSSYEPAGAPEHVPAPEPSEAPAAVLVDGLIRSYHELLTEENARLGENRWFLGQTQQQPLRAFLADELNVWLLADLRDALAYVVLGDGTEHGKRLEYTGKGELVVKWMTRALAYTPRHEEYTPRQRVADLRLREQGVIPTLADRERIIRSEAQKAAAPRKTAPAPTATPKVTAAPQAPTQTPEQKAAAAEANARFIAEMEAARAARAPQKPLPAAIRTASNGMTLQQIHAQMERTRSSRIIESIKQRDLEMLEELASQIEAAA
jgi:hypothetical protein